MLCRGHAEDDTRDEGPGREENRQHILKAVETIILRRRIMEPVPAVQRTIGCTSFFENLDSMIQESIEDNVEKIETEIKDRMRVSLPH